MKNFSKRWIDNKRSIHRQKIKVHIHTCIHTYTYIHTHIYIHTYTLPLQYYVGMKFPPPQCNYHNSCSFLLSPFRRNWKSWIPLESRLHLHQRTRRAAVTTSSPLTLPRKICALAQITWTLVVKWKRTLYELSFHCHSNGCHNYNCSHCFMCINQGTPITVIIVIFLYFINDF